MDSSVQDFLDQIYVRSHSDESVKTYRNCLKKFCEFLDVKYQCKLSQMVIKLQNHEKDVFKLFNEFVVFLDKSGIKARSIHLRTNAVKSYLRFCGIKIYSEDFKYAVKLPKKYKTQDIPLTKEIILRLLRNVSPKLQAVILVAVSTGMRVGEIVQFRINDIDFESKPVKITLRAEITKTRTTREVFLTTEATITLKDYLKRHHDWDENSTNNLRKPVFGRTSISRLPLKKDSELKTSPEIAAKMVLQKTLENAIKKIPELDSRMENGKRAIHFHGFRKFFRTTVGNALGRDFAEALMGHSFYLDTYYQLEDEKKREMFLDVESLLTISDFKAVENNLKQMNDKCQNIEDKINGLMNYLQKNSIEIPEIFVKHNI